MKKLVIILVLTALLVGTIGGCGLFGRGGVMADYEALLAEMAALRSYRFDGTAELSLEPAFLGNATISFAEDMPIFFSVEGAVSTYEREMRAVYQYRRADGAPMFDMEMIFTERTMYIGLASMINAMLRPVFEEMGVDLASFSVENLLQGHTHVALPVDEALGELLFAPVEVTEGFDVEPFLTRQGDAFVVTVQGEDVREMAGEIDTIFSQFIVDGIGIQSSGEIGDALGDMGQRIIGADLAEAGIVMITSRVGEAFHQNIQMQIPGYLDMRMDFALIAEEVLPVSPPQNALTESAFQTLVQNIDFDTIFDFRPDMEAPDVGNQGGSEDVHILHDLALLSLVGQYVHEGSLLELAALGNGQGGEHSVLVVAGQERTQGETHIFCGTDAVEMYYTSLAHLDAVEAILQAVVADRVDLFLPDSTLNFGTLRTDADRRIAAMGIAERTTAGLDRVRIYLSQVIPETGDVIRLELSLYTTLFTDIDDLIIAELSVHIGLDLNAYIVELLGG